MDAIEDFVPLHLYALPSKSIFLPPADAPIHPTTRMVKTDSNDGPRTDGKKLLDQTFPLRADMAEAALVRRLMEAGAVSGQNFTLVRDGLLSAIIDVIHVAPVDMLPEDILRNPEVQRQLNRHVPYATQTYFESALGTVIYSRAHQTLIARMDDLAGLQELEEKVVAACTDAHLVFDSRTPSTEEMESFVKELADEVAKLVQKIELASGPTTNGRRSTIGMISSTTVPSEPDQAKRLRNDAATSKVITAQVLRAVKAKDTHELAAQRTLSLSAHATNAVDVGTLDPTLLELIEALHDQEELWLEFLTKMVNASSPAIRVALQDVQKRDAYRTDDGGFSKALGIVCGFHNLFEEAKVKIGKLSSTKAINVIKKQLSTQRFDPKLPALNAAQILSFTKGKIITLYQDYDYELSVLETDDIVGSWCADIDDDTKTTVATVAHQLLIDRLRHQLGISGMDDILSTIDKYVEEDTQIRMSHRARKAMETAGRGAGRNDPDIMILDDESEPKDARRAKGGKGKGSQGKGKGRGVGRGDAAANGTQRDRYCWYHHVGAKNGAPCDPSKYKDGVCNFLHGKTTPEVLKSLACNSCGEPCHNPNSYASRRGGCTKVPKGGPTDSVAASTDSVAASLVAAMQAGKLGGTIELPGGVKFTSDLDNANSDSGDVNIFAGLETATTKSSTAPAKANADKLIERVNAVSPNTIKEQLLAHIRKQSQP